MRTTAAVTEERGAPFTIQDVDVDDPRPGEVRVELVACGVCHTDAIARDGDLPFPFPGVLGHEGVGRVEAVGEASPLWRSATPSCWVGHGAAARRRLRRELRRLGISEAVPQLCPLLRHQGGYPGFDPLPGGRTG